MILIPIKFKSEKPIMNKKAFLIALSFVVFSTTLSVFAQNSVPPAPPAPPKPINPLPVPKRISGGVVNGSAIKLPKPKYPAVARAANIKGSVNIAVVISKRGNIMSARAVSGHPLLRNAAVSAARTAIFRPTLLSGQAVEVSGVIVYNFLGNPDWTSIGMDFGNAESKGLRSTIYLLEGFENEQEQIDLLAKDSSSNQKAQLDAIATTIKSKLTPIDAWEFEFGRARAKTLGTLRDISSSYEINDNQSGEGLAVLKSLEAFRSLSINAPTDVKSYILERINKIVEIADNRRFTREDKENLIHYLR